MQHIEEGRMWEELLDGSAFTEVERDHLSLCSECQPHYATLALIHDEFGVARASEVRPEAEAQLFTILEQVRQENPQRGSFRSHVGKMAEWVRALPLWDSRQQAGAIGIRSAKQASYRLLFGQHETEIELMVEPQGRLLRVMGEVMVADDGLNGLALIELASTVDAKRAIETESDHHGRFSMEHIPPGTYVLTITPRFSPMVVIEPLELT